MKYLRKFNSVQEMQAAVLADNVSFLGLAQPQGQEPTMTIHVHVPVLPSNLTISCSNNTVTISATNATTLEYKLSPSAEYITYTAPFAITETVTVYAKASTSDGSIADSQECVYVKPIDYSIPFYVEDLSGNSNTLTIKKNNNYSPTLTIEKSTDGTTWESMGSTSTTGITATIPANGKLYLRTTTTSWCGSNNKYYNYINASDNHGVGGNIMSLLYGNDFQDKTIFPSGSTRTLASLFPHNTKLVDASQLILRPTTLTDMCYKSMFEGCASLTAAPELPATILTPSCYNMLFYQCTLLNEITTYANDISATNCLSNWLAYVSSTGTFHNMGSAIYPISSSGIPNNWTEVHS